MSLSLAEYEQKNLINQTPTKSNLDTWYSKLLKENNIFVLRDKREQLPITEEELQLPIRLMETKADCGKELVADYMFMVKNYTGRFIVERKSIADLYGTLYSTNNQTHEKQRERLYREIQRFYEDDRFDQFIIMVEGSFMDFLRYVPLKERLTEEEYWLKVQSMMGSKKSTINSLNVRPGVKVIFCDSRADMVERFRDMIRQWVLHSYKEILHV